MADRVVIKGVKHAFKLSVLLFNANNTFQWLKGEAEGGKKELEVKGGRQGGKPKKLSKGEKLRLFDDFSHIYHRNQTDGHAKILLIKE